MKNILQTIEKRYLTGGIGITLVAALAVNLLVIQGRSDASPGHDGGHENESVIQGTDSKYPLVSVVQPTNGSKSTQAIEAAGQVLSEKQGDVFARRDGIISQLYVNLGSTVYKGQVLARLQPDKDQTEIASEIAFKKRQLELAQKRSAIKTDTHIVMADKSIVSTKAQEQARLEQILARESGIKKELSQKTAQVETVAFDLLDSVAEVLFTRSDGLSSYYRHSNDDYYRRKEVYYGRSQELEVKAFELEALLLYKDLKEQKATKDADALVSKLVEMGNKARLYAQSISDSPNFTYSAVDELRKEIAETMDHIIDISLEYQEKESEFLQLQAEKKFVAAEASNTVLESEKGKVEILAVQKDANIDTEEVQAEIEKLQMQLGASSTVYAPFSGVITKRLVNLGDSVNDEKALFSMVDDTHKFVRFYVSENDLPFIAKERKIQFSPTAAPAKKHDAVIQRISKAIDPVNRTILVEADISSDANNASVLTEMTVRVSVPINVNENQLVIPDSAFDLSKSQKEVWVVNASAEAEKREVAVEYFYGGFAYVSEGIQKDDWVITKSPVELKSGVPVDTMVTP